MALETVVVDFETHSLSVFSENAGPPTFPAGVARTGTYCCRIAPGGGVVQYGRLPAGAVVGVTSAGTKKILVRAFVRINAFPSSNPSQIRYARVLSVGGPQNGHAVLWISGDTISRAGIVLNQRFGLSVNTAQNFGPPPSGAGGLIAGTGGLGYDGITWSGGQLATGIWHEVILSVTYTPTGGNTVVTASVSVNGSALSPVGYTPPLIGGTTPTIGQVAIGNNGGDWNPAVSLDFDDVQYFAADGADAANPLPPPIVLDPDTIGPLARDEGLAAPLIITAAGGFGGPYTFAITDGDLPPGLTLAADGTISGYPTEAGSFTVTIEATDDAGETGDKEYEIVVSGLRVTIDGLDVTRKISHADFDLALNRRSTALIILGDETIPARGADVVIYARDGVTPILDGLILTRSIRGMTPSNPANEGNLDVVDYSIFFDDPTISIEHAAAVALEDVIEEIVDLALADYGITYTPTATGITLEPFSWVEVSVTEAFKRITDATGVVFRERPFKVLDVFVPLDAPAPVAITDATINAFDLSWQDGAALPANTVDLLCGPAGQGIATQRWTKGTGETEWEVDIQAVLGNAEPARAAHGFLGTTGNFADGETVTLGSSVYTFRAALVGDVAGEVLIGADAEASLGNLAAAITNAGGSGYAPSTPANADASGYVRQPDQLAAEALTPGAAGNAIAVDDTAANALWYGEGAIPIAALELGSDATGAGGWTQGYVLEDGSVAQPIGAPGSGAYYEWDVTDGRGTVSIGSGTPAPDGTVLELKYLAAYPFHAVFSTGTPPRTYRESHPEIVNYADGLALAEAIHARESVDKRELEIATDVDGFLPGQELDVDTTHRGGIDATFLVAGVRGKIVNAELWEYTITAQQSAEYQGSYVEQWKKLVTGGGGSSDAAPGVLTPTPTGIASIEPGSILNVHVNAAAGIEYSKLALTGSIVNGDIVSLAGSKLTGAYTAAGLTMATARLLGRTGGGAGAVEEISVAGSLSLVGGVLTGTAAGTVTAVSVANANGFAGTSSGGATPALTLSTTINGVLKGNGTAISAATAGTDYSAGTSALATGIVKSTTGTGALSIAVAGDFPTLNQNTTGSAASLSATLVVGSGGTGTATAFTAGSIVFAGAGGTYAQDNTNLFWDDTNKRIGIGITTPPSLLTVNVGADTTGNIGVWPSACFVVSRGGGATSEGIGFGVHAANDYSWIEAAQPGSQARSLLLNPAGGFIYVGTGNAVYPLAGSTGGPQLSTPLDVLTLKTSGDFCRLRIFATTSDGGGLVIANSATNVIAASVVSDLRAGQLNFYLTNYMPGGFVGFASHNGSSVVEDARFKSGRFGVGVTSPTAIIHIKAGTATANTAPLKFTSGTLNTTPEAMAVEALTDNLYFTITTAAARKGIVLDDGARLTSGRIPKATTNGRLIDGPTPLAGTKVYYASDSNGGPVDRKLTFTDGILVSET